MDNPAIPDYNVKSLSDRELLESIYIMLCDGRRALDLYQAGNKIAAWRVARKAGRDAVPQDR